MKKSTTTPKYKSIKPVRFAKHRYCDHPTTRDVVAVLRKARKHVEINWGQGAMINEWGQVCAMGALNCAAGGDPYLGGAWPIASEAAYRAGLALTTAIPPSAHVYTVVGYNDARGRTRGQMLALFDRAIENTRAEAVTK